MSILQSQQRRGEYENYSSRERDEGRGGGQEEGSGIDLTLGESQHSSVYFRSCARGRGVVIWQVGGRGQDGDLGG